MKKIYLFHLLLLLASCVKSVKKDTPNKNNSLSDADITDKYVKNGAWRYQILHPNYQLYLDSAIAVKPGMAYLHQ